MSHRILLVDDDPMNMAILQEILDEFPAEIETASDGPAALEAAERIEPHLMVLDIMMPGIDGYEVCQRIKQAEWGKRTHVVLVSAKASTPERLRGYEAGADDYLTKPFDEDELLAKMRVQLRLRDALTELAEARKAIEDENKRLEQLVNERTQEVVETRDIVVFALAQLAESRDPETGEHLERIRHYCRVLSEQLAKNSPYADQISEAFIASIFLSSPLHDVGKVGIPDTILLKPGRLSDSEFNLMKQHTLIGAQSLEASSKHGGEERGGFLKMAVDIARYHHEKYDGSGYPEGLVGQAIPLAARICAVADVFDALTSIRVYKSAFTIDTARTMIVNDSGTHFEPAIVDAFVECFDQFSAIRLKYQEGDSKPADSAA